MLPQFQPQNPDRNGYYLGWQSCTSYAYAMAASYDRQVKLYVTGERLRRATGDKVGGTTLAQNDAALARIGGFDLEVRVRYPWSEFARRIDQGEAAVLQGHGEVFVGTKFFCNASVNHAITVPPGWGAMDPAADGRREGIYRYHGEAYPRALLRKFAARLILDPRYPNRRLGDGLVYAAFTRDRTTDWQVIIRPQGTIRREFTYYFVRNLPDGRRVITSAIRSSTAGFTVPSTNPKIVYGVSMDRVVSLVKLEVPDGHMYEGRWVSADWAHRI